MLHIAFFGELQGELAPLVCLQGVCFHHATNAPHSLHVLDQLARIDQQYREEQTARRLGRMASRAPDRLMMIAFFSPSNPSNTSFPASYGKVVQGLQG
jgi:hypothetical protein